jgi:hypothetical protein
MNITNFNRKLVYSRVWFAAVKGDREAKIVEVMPHIFMGGS